MVKYWSALIFLAGCSHRPVAPAYEPPPPPYASPTAAPAPPTGGTVSLPRDWWVRPGIVDAPLAQLVRVNVRGMPWKAAAQRLGFPQAGFDSDAWGAFSVMAHSGANGQDFAIYLDEAAETSYGVIVRGKTALPAGALATLTEAARRADHGDTWKLYTYDDYTVFASDQRPVTEIGCSGPETNLVCYAAVYGMEVAPEAFTSVRGNETAVFQRRVRVK